MLRLKDYQTKGCIPLPQKMSVFGPGLAFVLVSCLSVSHAQFRPTLEVVSCTQGRLTVTVTGAADYGLIYIKGQHSGCTQTTISGVVTHEFDFISCGIQWGKKFNIVIQKKSLYQTGTDRQFPVTCLTDLSDLIVISDVNTLDKTDEKKMNFTVKPSVYMTLFKDGVDISGGNVKITDVITMEIQLDPKYKDDFDIKVSSCSASNIPIIENSCSLNPDLFPDFSHPSQGVLSATFGAFRTTSLNGGSVGMTFTCVLQTCLGPCSPEACFNGMAGWGRKRREVHTTLFTGSAHGARHRAARDDPIAFGDVNVGSSLHISAEDFVMEEDGVTKEPFCIDKATFTAGVATVISGVVASGVASVVVMWRMMAKKVLMKRLRYRSMI